MIATSLQVRQSLDVREAEVDLERLSYGIGSGVASVVIRPETPDEQLRRVLKEASEGKR